VTQSNTFNTRTSISTASGDVNIYRLDKLELDVSQLPFSIKVLLEALLRNEDGHLVTVQDVRNLAAWNATAPALVEIPFKPVRIIMQDFTGVPSVVDLAAMRAAMQRMGGDPARINPLIPVDIVIDHSVQVDHFGSGLALFRNAYIEFQRNEERYATLAWASKAFDNLRVVPPETGIVHQVNLEYLGRVVQRLESAAGVEAFPDSLVGTDSHTTMINGLGILAWGVGGIEAEAALLGQPVYILAPEVIGLRFFGELPEGTTATDLTLTVVQMLRARGVVGKFVEFYGPGLSNMSLPDRATIANMAPEYGATIGFFPVDAETLDYMRQTARPTELIDLVERYSKEQGLFRTDDTPEPVFTDTLELDLGSVQTSLAGPKRPHDRVPLVEMKRAFSKALRAPTSEYGFALDETAAHSTVDVALASNDNGAQPTQLSHGAVVIAAITSCTNTSNPSVMLAAGLLAKNAVEKGLTVKPYVKTSLAPGSRVVTEYLEAAELTPYLEQLGFYTVGYGCTTCIGNSGPLSEVVSSAVEESGLVAASVLSGNRNFEGRIHPLVKASYLASPPLVVAYALVGTVDIDLETEPLGLDNGGQAVYLRDIWPSQSEIAAMVEKAVSPDQFADRYADVFTGNERWNEVAGVGGALYDWDDASTYIQEPPFFVDMPLETPAITPVRGARVLALLGDSVTTDHISPAGGIAGNSPAGEYLLGLGVERKDFNTYGSRRGNDRVLLRGTFANIRLKNLLAPGTEGGVTTYLPSGEQMTIFDAAEKYKEDGTPLVILTGAEYGIGSSRDWAAKGTQMLGVRAVISASLERIHRSNLIGMGVMPLQFKDGETWQSLGLTGHETFDIDIPDDLQPQQDIAVHFTREDGSILEFTTTCRIDAPVEVEYYRNGGILHTVLRNMLKE